MKEEEKLARTIRGLAKLPENRRCINCNSLGPQYVCTTFNTFICQICSGIHREFTHRVKSISMAKFSQDEVNALQAGGNEEARQIFFKEYDPQRQPLPDSSNMYKLRDFIKHVYMDGRFTGETSLGQLPRLRLTDKKALLESRKSISPRSEGRYDRHYSGSSSPSGRSEDISYRHHYDERRSPRYPRDSSRSGGYRKSLIKFEVVDDRFRDESGTGSRSLARRPPFEESKLHNKSPENQRNVDDRSTSSTPTKKEMPGHDAGVRSSIPVGHVKQDPSADNLVTTDENEAKQKVAPAETPAAISDDKKLPETPVEPQKQLATPSDNNSGNTSKSSRKKSTLEELLFELSVPAPTSLENSFEGLGSIVPQSTEPQAKAQTEPQITTTPRQVVSHAATGGFASETAEELKSTQDVSLKPTEGPSPNVLDKAAESGGEMSPSIQQIPPPLPPPKEEISLKDQELFQSKQPLFHMNNEDETPTNPSEKIQTAVPETSVAEAPRQHVVEQNPANTLAVPEINVTEASQQVVVEQMPESTRKELPADFFTPMYPSAHNLMQVWRTGIPAGMGFNMQYYHPMMAPSPVYSALSMSTNPFNVDNGANITQGLPFPSMIPLQGTLPNAPSDSHGFRPDLSLASPSAALMQSQPPACSPFMLNQSPYAIGPSLGTQMEQQPGINNMRHFGVHGFRGHRGDSSAASSLTTHQQMTMNYSAPGMPIAFPSSGRGNPFD